MIIARLSWRSGSLGFDPVDPFGRLDSVRVAGEIAERHVYDRFDGVAGQRIRTKITRNTDDPLDRTATTTKNVGALSEKKTVFAYLGLTGQLLGKVEKCYQYAPWRTAVAGQAQRKWCRRGLVRRHNAHNWLWRSPPAPFVGQC